MHHSRGNFKGHIKLFVLSESNGLTFPLHSWSCTSSQNSLEQIACIKGFSLILSIMCKYCSLFLWLGSHKNGKGYADRLLSFKLFDTCRPLGLLLSDSRQRLSRWAHHSGPSLFLTIQPHIQSTIKPDATKDVIITVDVWPRNPFQILSSLRQSWLWAT